MSGRKRRLLVDTPGLIWGSAVLPASPIDRDGAAGVSKRVDERRPRPALVRADSAYRAKALAAWVEAHRRWAVEAVGERRGQTTSEVRTWRRVVERTSGRFGRYRRLSEGYEHDPASSEARIDIATIRRMSRLSMPERNRDDDPLKRPPIRLKT